MHMYFVPENSFLKMINFNILQASKVYRTILYFDVAILRTTFINTLFPVPMRKFSKWGQEVIIINN